ncbi:hypothetical protein [Mycobacteroides franklinii]
MSRSALVVVLMSAVAVVVPVSAAAEPHDCSSVDKARQQIQQMTYTQGQSASQVGATRNRAIAEVLRNAAAGTTDDLVRTRATDAAAAADQYADQLSAVTSVTEILPSQNDAMVRAVNAMATLEQICPIVQPQEVPEPQEVPPPS